MADGMNEDGHMPPPFGVDPHRLAELNEPGDIEGNRRNLEKLGGTAALAKLLSSDLRQGLSGDSEDNRRRVFHFGENKFPAPPFTGFWKLFLETFKDLILIILLIAATVALVIGLTEDPSKGWIDGVAIYIAVLIVSFVTAGNDYSKERQFRALSDESERAVEVKVIRGGSRIVIDIHEVLVGDIVSLDTGNRVPADGIFIEGSDCKAEESAITGETDDKSKGVEDDCFLLSGSTIASGRCDMLVIAVGTRSMQGKIRQDTASEAEDTPLQKKLDVIAKQIGYIGTGAAIGTFLALFIVFFVADTREDNFGKHILHAFIISVTIIVVAIPEGLPLAVTISLAYSTKKMLRDKNLIRVLAACETMGNATTICSDKTGTLTQNRMTVVEGWVAGEKRTFDGISTDDVEAYNNLPAVVRDYIVDHMAINTTATYNADEAGQPKVVGSKTEGAMILLLRSWKLDYEDLRRDLKTRIKKQYMFSADRKMMTTIVRSSDVSGLKQFTTGGSDVVLARSTRVLRADGSVEDLTDKEKRHIHNAIDTMANKALRTLALAYREYECEADLPEGWESTPPENNLTLYAIVGIKDPLRKEVPDAVATCMRAGILVRMVTGDNVKTARAIARECGILTDGVSLEGPEFRHMTPKQLDSVINRLQVLARSSPRDKYTLVTRLNGLKLPRNNEEWEDAHPDESWEADRDNLLPGYYDEWKASRLKGNRIESDVVGVTGDGTNDAPALKAADVGLSMGISGTEVAKEASDIVILDDNFASIVKAVLWGRSVYDNIRKFLQFQLTVNVVALALTFISAVSIKDPPLNAVMMLWVNLIMDTLGALALGTEPPVQELLHRRPYTRNASLVSRKMWRNILVQSVLQLVLTLIFVYDGDRMLGLEDNEFLFDHAGLDRPVPFVTDLDDFLDDRTDAIVNYRGTFIFNLFVFCQLFNEINSRAIGDKVDVFTGIAKNWLFALIWLGEVGLQVFIIEVGGDFTDTTGLTMNHWGLSIALALITFPVGILQRFIPIDEKEADFIRRLEISTIRPGDASLTKKDQASNPPPSSSVDQGKRKPRNDIIDERDTETAINPTDSVQVRMAEDGNHQHHQNNNNSNSVV